MADSSASSAILRIMLRATGLSLAEVIRAAGLSEEQLTGGTVSYGDGMRVWQAVAELSGDATIGHTIGTSLRLHHVGVFGPLVAHSESVRAGLLATCRAFAVALPAGCLTTEDTAQSLIVRYARPEHPTWVRHGVESLFATLVGLVREASQRDISPARVDLSFPAPRAAEAYERFYGAPVTFDSAVDQLVFSGPLLDAPMIGSEPALLRVIEERASEVLGSARNHERALHVCSELFDEGKYPTLEEAAKRLGVSSRTLQRKLSAESVSFRQLREKAARALAERLLREGDLSVDAIAERTGYAGRSAFERAFSRWTGLTPARWRREHAS